MIKETTNINATGKIVIKVIRSFLQQINQINNERSTNRSSTVMPKDFPVGIVDIFTILGLTFEAWQPDPGARPRLEDKDSNQGSQSTRSGIGLVHRRLVSLSFGVPLLRRNRRPTDQRQTNNNEGENRNHQSSEDPLEKWPVAACESSDCSAGDYEENDGRHR